MEPTGAVPAGGGRTAASAPMLLLPVVDAWLDEAGCLRDVESARYSAGDRTRQGASTAVAAACFRARLAGGEHVTATTRSRRAGDSSRAPVGREHLRAPRGWHRIADHDRARPHPAEDPRPARRRQACRPRHLHDLARRGPRRLPRRRAPVELVSSSAPPTDRASSLRPNGGTGAAVSSQPTAPARRRADELGPPSLGVAVAVRVVFGTRVVGVTLVHCPCRVLGPLQARGQRRLRRPASGSSTPFRLSRLPPCTRGSA